MAGAIWTEPPTPEALLAARLAAGWLPTPSDFVDGEKVVGNAASCSTNRS